jgi:hypothetical protein
VPEAVFEGTASCLFTILAKDGYMSILVKGFGYLNGCLTTILGILISVFSFIGLAVFPSFGFSGITIILGIVISIFGIVGLVKTSEYKDWSTSKVKSEAEIDENTSFDELQEIKKRRGW